MATRTKSEKVPEVDYPTSDGRPMAETPLHRDVLIDGIRTLEHHFAEDPMVYVSGNMLVYYVKGDKHQHVSPDNFVVFGVKKDKPRDYYLLWEEKKSPSTIIEITSKSTRKEDVKTKWKIYRDILKVKEYYLFDPTGDYLKPRLQGHRRIRGDYVSIAEINGRLPSKTLGLHLEADGTNLRFFNPTTSQWLPTLGERVEVAEERADLAVGRADRLAEELARVQQELKRLKEDRP